jgi:hypothetical protein
LKKIQPEYPEKLSVEYMRHQGQGGDAIPMGMADVYSEAIPMGQADRHPQAIPMPSSEDQHSKLMRKDSMEPTIIEEEKQ